MVGKKEVVIIDFPWDIEKIEGIIIDFPWKTVNKNYFNFEINEAKRENKMMFDTVLKMINVKW